MKPRQTTPVTILTKELNPAEVWLQPLIFTATKMDGDIILSGMVRTGHQTTK